MGEIDGAFRSWGLARGGTGAISNAIADAAREAGAEIRTEAPIAKIIVKNGRAAGVVLENGDEIHADVVSSSVDPRLTFMKMVGAEHLPDGFRRRRQALQVSRLVGQGESRARRLAGLHRAAGRGRAPARRDLHLAERRLHGARLRRSQVRPLLASPVHRHRHPEPDRPFGRAAGQARHVLLRAVRALQPEAKAAGTSSAKRSATRSSTPSPSTRRTSRTSSSIARS